MNLYSRRIESSTIRHGVHYANCMFLTFKNGDVYLYDEVPIGVFDELCDSESPGAYLNKNVKGVYTYKRVLKATLPKGVT